mgnify:CR=1 FL=1
MRNIEIIQKLNTMHTACESELLQLITTYDEKDFEYLRKCARDTANRIFGNKIYIRGLIEFSSICKNDCFYCGLRRSNGNAVRYDFQRMKFSHVAKTDTNSDSAHLCCRAVRTDFLQMM